MTKALSDTQLIILSAACNRDDRNIYPVTTKLAGGALSKVLKSLIGKGLLEEAPAGLPDTVWRADEEGNRLTLRATQAAEAALGIGDTAEGRLIRRSATKGTTAKGRTHRGHRPAKKRPPATANGRQPQSIKKTGGKNAEPRTGTKQARLIDMLKRKRGVTIEEAVAALAWQPHTVRGAMAGALKKRLRLEIVSEKDEKRGRVYRIPAEGAQ